MPIIAEFCLLDMYFCVQGYGDEPDWGPHQRPGSGQLRSCVQGKPNGVNDLLEIPFERKCLLHN